ncbi:AMP-binding protein [Vallicoccus soli]|uniref:Non-ribosomal peptide synthetase n=1 Tax=Vallicoccus soli TaxID=2339232 RepID=A0A3A3YWJ3_9ACTN|nr:AMP-binding protein [Vallicoccus soli]RJK94279.1 non-ribosomal peptide synthetase [Vallicoccus soli]
MTLPAPGPRTPPDPRTASGAVPAARAGAPAQARAGRDLPDSPTRGLPGRDLPGRDLPGWDLEAPVAARWAGVVAADPSAAALVRADGRALDRAALDRWAGAVAAAARGLPGGDAPLAVLASHDERAAAAVLGVLATGRPLVVLDAAAPPGRSAAVLDAAGARAVLADEGTRAHADALGLPVLDVDALAAPDAPSLPAAERAAPPAGAPALLAFTSGSTGAPKGVVQTQRAVLQDCALRADAGWSSPGDQVALLLPVAFAGGFAVMLTTLLSGATAHFHDPRAVGVGGLAAWLRTRAATALVATPSLLRAVDEDLPAGEVLPAPLRLVMSTGEALPGRLAGAVLDRLPRGARLLNLVGSSETCLYAAHAVRPEDARGTAPVPAGRPVAGREVRLLDEDGVPVAPGATGWVHVVSRWLPVAYWRDPALTAERFALDEDGTVTVRTGDLARTLPDGALELLGRGDLAVKVRGYRVEPAEVERALLACPGVVEAVVVGQQDEGRPVRLVAHLVLDRSAPARTTALRAQLRRTLPGHMVPEAFAVLDALPRNERGKVDRAALAPVPTGSSAAYAAPRTDWERVLAALWSEVLQVGPVGRDDDFFELGGDSLATQELLERLQASTGVEVTTDVLVAAPTLAAFARQVTSTRDERHPTLVPVQPSGTRTPLFCVAGAGGVALGFVFLARRLGPDQPVWAVQAKGLEEGGLPDWSVRAHARRHLAALRTVQPHGPYRLAGFSFGSTVAYEMAQQLADRGEEVELLVALDGYAPAPEHLAPAPPSPHGRVRTRAKLWLTGLREDGSGRGHFHRFWLQGDHLLRRYRGRPWGGRTLVVVGDPEDGVDRAGGWDRFLTGPWRLVRVPGEHLSLLHEPNVAPLAAAVAEELDALDGR